MYKIINREDGPYYGRFKCKILLRFSSSLYSSYGANSSRTHSNSQISSYLKNEFKDDTFKFRDDTIYFVNISDCEKFAEIYANDILELYRPAKGYETASGKEFKKQRYLWHEKYPYKISLKKLVIDKTNEMNHWCTDNLVSDFKIVGGWNNVASIFFLSALDFITFKIMYTDSILSESITDQTGAEKELEMRIIKAQNDLKDFKEGTNIKIQKDIEE